MTAPRPEATAPSEVDAIARLRETVTEAVARSLCDDPGEAPCMEHRFEAEDMIEELARGLTLSAGPEERSHVALVAALQELFAAFGMMGAICGVNEDFREASAVEVIQLAARVARKHKPAASDEAERATKQWVTRQGQRAAEPEEG